MIQLNSLDEIELIAGTNFFKTLPNVIFSELAIEFLDNIRKHGILNEEELILKTLKLGAVKKLKIGTKMILKGKYKPLPILGETIDELDEIETMYKELKKDE